MRNLTLGSAAILFAAASALTACGPSRSEDDAGFDSGVPACIGICNNTGKDGGTDAGTDAGTTDGGGNGGFDAGPPCEQFPAQTGGAVSPGTLDVGVPTTIRDLRYGTGEDGGFVNFGSHVILTGVQVTAISYINPNPSATSTTTEFWVIDPADPTTGMWVHLRATDTAYLPTVGDILTIDGFFATDSATFSPFARRYTIANNYAGSGSPNNRPVTITQTGTAALPADNAVEVGCAFDAQGGLRRMEQGDQPYAGARIHINGPLTLTTAEPVALTRLQIEADGGLTIRGYQGFEVTGGILVNDEQTWDAADGGCNWRAVVSDGGTVTFPDGISGVFDTYAAAPCVRSASGSCTYMRSYVPNANGLLPDAGFHPYYTFALYPQSCDDLQGTQQ